MSTKTADFYDLLIGQLGRCIDDLERCRRQGMADGGQTEKELLDHLSHYFWHLSLGLDERAEKIKGEENGN